jgi:hypothetical protein
VRAVTPDGKINTIAGNDAATVAALKAAELPAIAANTPALSPLMLPYALAIGPTGNIYVASFSVGVLALTRGSGSVSNLAPDTRTWASDFNGSNALTVLDGTSVTIGGQPAYVSYTISPGQVNAQVPTGIGTGAQPMVISTAHGTSPTYAVTVQAELLGLLAPPCSTSAAISTE